MFGKTVLSTLVALSLAVVCSASPLMDYSAGKTSLDLNFKPSSDLSGEGVSLDGKGTNLDLGVTAGLGNKFAVQYRYNTGDSKSYNGNLTYGSYDIIGSANTTFKAQELNVLYKMDKNVSAFIGWVQATPGLEANGTINGTAVSGSVDTNNNGYQVGLVGSTKLGDKFTGYGMVAAGNKLTNYEVGVSYEVAQNLELNLGYKDAKYKNLTLKYDGDSTPEFSYEVKGLTYGLTYKF